MLSLKSFVMDLMVLGATAVALPAAASTRTSVIVLPVQTGGFVNSTTSRNCTISGNSIFSGNSTISGNCTFPGNSTISGNSIGLLEVPANAISIATEFFANANCNDPHSKFQTTITSNICIDLGEDNTTQSILFTELLEPYWREFCEVKVWQDEKCRDPVNNYVKQLEEMTCVGSVWGNNDTSVPFDLGSVMLVCIAPDTL